MHYLLLLAFLLSLTTSVTQGQTRRSNTSSSKTRSTTETPAIPLSLGATVEKFVRTYDINADGTARETTELQKRCSTNQCIEAFSTYVQYFNTSLQTVKVVEAYLIKADGKKVNLPPTAITDRPTAQAEAAPAFSSLRELEIKYAEWRIGDAAYLKIEGSTTKPPILDGRYDTLELFSPLFAWKSIEIRVSAPVGYDVFVDAVGLDGGKLADDGGRSRWRYTKTDLPNINIEPMMDQYSAAPRFALTTFRNPAELGAVFWEIVKKKTVVTPDIQALADEITKGSTTPEQQASAIYDWVNKNIRYLFVVLDRSGWIPSDAAQIARNRYGDCKDYTVLIHTLLKAKGIESVPVLIRSDFGNWFPAVPTTDYFNHAILYIPSLNLFADATLPNTRLGQIPQTLVGKKAVLAGEKTGVIDVPKDNPSDNQLISEVVYTFSPEGNVKARAKNKYVGRSEIVFRPLFAGRDSNAVLKMMFAVFGVEGDGKLESVSNPHRVGEPFGVELETEARDYTTFVAEGTFPVPSGMNLISFAAMKPFAESESRKTTLELGATRVAENITIELPAGVRVTTVPESVNFTTRIGSFKSTPALKDGRLSIARELVISKDSITPADYTDFRNLVQKLVESKSLQVSYTADMSLIPAKSSVAKASKSEPKSLLDKVYEALTGPALAAPLKTSEVRSLEMKLAANENDDESRMKLLRHYLHFDTKQTPAVKASFLKHRVWMIRNRPRVGDEDISRWGLLNDLPETARVTLKDEWLEAVRRANNDSAIRFNAIAFLEDRYPEEAAKLSAEGLAIDPGEYKYPLMMVELAQKDLRGNSSAAVKKAIALKVLEHGKSTLSLIKKERSAERDSDRRNLLKILSAAAVAADDLDLASALATELVLDFGQSVGDYDYSDVTHRANITLGRVEVRRNNLAKAKEYLLIGIRAPLRQADNYLWDLDLRLAKELYEKGVRDEVLEFLRLCLELPPFKKDAESNEARIRALKLWQEQIGKGIAPTFDFAHP